MAWRASKSRPKRIVAGRARYTEGFTLAELLLAVAVIIVLVAIAIPSIVAAQSNMRMLELNNAAEQIANAAQAQMTGEKVSGTWWTSIQQGGEGAHAEDCKYAEATAAPGDGSRPLYYMTAGEAKSAGIVPSLSIDEDVRDAEYVIEFDAQTASVVRVFFADGKSGFFGSANAESAQGVYAYYAAGGGSIALGARTSNDPMIGLFAGTAAGATSAIALKNPVISIDESTGRLLVRDPNLDGITGAGATQTSLILTRTEHAEGEQPAAVRIAGLSSGTKTVTVSLVGADDDETQGDYATSITLKASDLLKQVNQSTLDGVGNVFSIDLNALARAVEDASAIPGSKEIAAELKRFAPGDAVEAKASTRISPNVDGCVPATSTAFIEWPAPVGKLTLMISTPYSQTVEDTAVDGALESYLDAARYTQPTVEATTESPIYKAEAVPIAEDFKMKATAANNELTKRNKQAGWQSYAGGWISSDRAVGDDTLKLRVVAGSYRGKSTHQYQVWELWVQRANGEYTRAGYMRDNEWEWAKGFADLENVLTWYDVQGTAYEDIAGRNVADLGIVSVAVSGGASSYATLGSLGLLDADQNASIYVRTAPRMADVQAFFNDCIRNGNLKETLREKQRTGSRGYGYGLNLPIRQQYEEEFGASSSDVSWTVSRSDKGGLGDAGNRFLGSDSLRVYYSIAPGLAFDNIKANQGLLSLGSTEMTNTVLWLYRAAAGSGALDAQPAAFVQSGIDGKKYFCRSTEAADFELNDEYDWLFYRVVEYADDTGAPLAGYTMQYVPYTVQDDARYATVLSGVNKSDEDVFVGWTCDTTRDGKAIDVGVGTLVGTYGGVLDYGYNRLKGSYVKVGIGLVYFEQYADGSTGYYGYLSETQTAFDTLNDSLAIDSWGYRLIVPFVEGDKSKPVVAKGTWFEKSLTEQGTLTIYDRAFRSFSFNTGASMKTSTKTITYAFGGKTATYSFNLNFARAVAHENGEVRAATAFDGNGKAQPAWSVRHALQFPGALAPNGSDSSVQEQYMGDAFLQERDIDMRAAPQSTYDYQFIRPFRGLYDGGSHAIRGYFARLSIEKDHRLGLFPYVNGGTLKNIEMKEDGSHTIAWTNSIDAAFGCLAGVVVNGTIDRCTLTSDSVASISITGLNPTGGNTTHNTGHNIGGLVGNAWNTRIVHSSIENFSISVSSADGTWKTNEVHMGMLVGRVDATGLASVKDSLTALSAANSSLTVTARAAAHQTESIGGIAGLMLVSGEQTIEGWTANKLDLIVTADHPRDLLYAGGLVGEARGSVVVGSTNSCSAIVLQAEGAKEPLDAKMIGKSDEA